MFDFGESLYDRPASFKLWPTEGTNVALVDSDLLPYIVGATTEESKFAKAILRVEENEYGSLEETPEFEDAADHLDWMVNYWINLAGCDAAILYVTESKSNFRLDVCFTRPYKGQRSEEKPPFFSELKQHLIENHKAVVAIGCEADDLIVSEMHSRHTELVDAGAELGSPEHKKFSSVVAVSSDKDLRICPGWHYDPTKQERIWVEPLGWLEPVYELKEAVNYEYWPLVEGVPTQPDEASDPDRFVKGKRKGEVKTKRVKNGMTTSQTMHKLRGCGLKFFYAQILMGDDADNYPGAPGIGKTRAFEVINPCKTEEELYNAALEIYREVYGQSYLAVNYRGGSLRLSAEQLMVEQGRLAHMQTRRNEVWCESVYVPSGESDEWKS